MSSLRRIDKWTKETVNDLLFYIALMAEEDASKHAIIYFT